MSKTEPAAAPAATDADVAPAASISVPALPALSPFVKRPEPKSFDIETAKLVGHHAYLWSKVANAKTVSPPELCSLLDELIAEVMRLGRLVPSAESAPD
jgi:hypothetical protein